LAPVVEPLVVSLPELEVELKLEAVTPKIFDEDDRLPDLREDPYDCLG
jgi:hypothetical protein